MSAKAAHDATHAVLTLLDVLKRDIASGAVDGLVLVAMQRDGTLRPVWHASPGLGPYAGTILRGAVCWLAAEMDAKARGE